MNRQTAVEWQNKTEIFDFDFQIKTREISWPIHLFSARQTKMGK